MTIDERLEALTFHLELLTHSHESLSDSHAKTEAGLAKTEAGLAKTENILRRAIAASVKEARQERQKRRELDAKTTAAARKLDDTLAELAAAQVVTQKLFQAWLKRSANGKH